MADVFAELASKAGISPEQAQKGVGAVLGYFKDHLPADHFAKVSAAGSGKDRVRLNHRFYREFDRCGTTVHLEDIK